MVRVGSIAAAAVVACAATQVLGADGAKTFAWVPRAECKAPVKVCYQGAQEKLDAVKKVDVLNLCRDSADVVIGTCAKHGYGRHLGKDPIFKELDIYLKDKAPGERSQLDGLTKAIDVLETANKLDADEGLCWKPMHVRKGHLAKNSTCPANEDKQLDFCWEKCPSGAVGEGPLCLGSCPEDSPISFGPLCCATEQDCKKFSTSEALKLLLDIAKAVKDRENPAALIADLKHLVDDAKSLALSECS